MPSLTWILALTLTLLHCLSAAPTTNPENDILQRTLETIDQIEILNKTSCPMDDAKFYIQNVSKGDHIERMLQCATHELEVVAEECFKNRPGFEEYFRACSRTRDTIKEILEKAGGQKQDKATNIPCEGEEKSYEVFLKNLKELIQKLNTKI